MVLTAAAVVVEAAEVTASAKMKKKKKKKTFYGNSLSESPPFPSFKDAKMVPRRRLSPTDHTGLYGLCNENT